MKITKILVLTLNCILFQSIIAHSQTNYSLKIIAKTNQNASPSTISDLGWGSSINDSGKVAFTSKIADGWEAVFVSDGNSLEERSLLKNGFQYLSKLC